MAQNPHGPRSKRRLINRLVDNRDVVLWCASSCISLGSLVAGGAVLLASSKKVALGTMCYTTLYGTLISVIVVGMPLAAGGHPRTYAGVFRSIAMRLNPLALVLALIALCIDAASDMGRPR